MRFPARALAATAAAVTLALAGTGCSGAAGSALAPQAPPAAVSQAVAPPESIRLDRLGIASSLIPTAVADDGTFEVPEAAGQASWFAPGPEPGQPGRSILLGHVNLDGAAGVFGELHNARVGDVIVIRDEQGTEHRWQVERVERRTKAEFDPAALYAPVDRPEIVLITCGGALQRDAAGRGSYDSNDYVYASEVR